MLECKRAREQESKSAREQESNKVGEERCEKVREQRSIRVTCKGAKSERAIEQIGERQIVKLNHTTVSLIVLLSK